MGYIGYSSGIFLSKILRIILDNVIKGYLSTVDISV